MDRSHRLWAEKTNRVILPVLGRFRDEVYAKEQKTQVYILASRERRKKLVRRAGFLARLGGGTLSKKTSPQEDEIASLRVQIADALETSRRMIRFDFDTERKAKEAEITSTKAEVDDVNLQIIECERKLRHLASEKKEHELLHEQAIHTIGRHERECTKLEAGIPRQNAMIRTFQAHHQRIQVEYDKTRIKYNVARERHTVGGKTDSIVSYGNMFCKAGFVYREAAMKDIDIRKSELLLTIRSHKRTLGSIKKIHSNAVCVLKTKKRRAEYIYILGGNGKEALPSYEAHFEKVAMKRCVRSLRIHMQLDNTATSWKPAASWYSDIRTVVIALRGLFSKSDGFDFRRLMQKVDTIDVTPLAEALGGYLRSDDDKEWSALDRLDALRRQLDRDSRVKKKIIGYLLKRKRVWREYVRQYHNRRNTFEMENDLVLKKLTHHISELENQVIRLEGEVERFAHSSYFGEKTWRATVHKLFQDEVTNLQCLAKNDAHDIVLLEEKNDVAIFETIAGKTRETAALMADMRLKIQHHGTTHRNEARMPPDYGRNTNKTRVQSIPLAHLLQDGVPYVRTLFLCETHDVDIQTADEYAFFEDIYKSEKIVVTLFNEEEIAVRVMGGDILFYYAKVSDIAMLFENYADTWASIGEKIAQSIEIICDTGPRLFLPMPPLVDEGWTLSPYPSLGIQEATVVVCTACCIHDTVYAVTVYELSKYYAFRLYNPTGTPEISWTRAWIHTVLRSLDFSSCEQFRRCEDIQRRVSRFLQEKLGSLAKQTKHVPFPLHLQERSKNIGLALDSYSDETFGCQFFPVNTIKGRWQATVQNQFLPVLRAQKIVTGNAVPKLSILSPKLSISSSVSIDDEDWIDDWSLCSDATFEDESRPYSN